MNATKTILIADDDDEILAALGLRCRKLGLRVVVARTAFDALLEIRNSVPDVACLDVNMPAGDGLSVCEMVARDQDSHHLPVIVLTGRKDEGTIRRCRDMTAYYVAKGSDVWQQIEPILRKVLGLDAGARCDTPAVGGAAAAHDAGEQFLAPQSERSAHTRGAPAAVGSTSPASPTGASLAQAGDAIVVGPWSEAPLDRSQSANLPGGILTFQRADMHQPESD